MRVAINGYGRVARALIELWQDKDYPLELVLIRNSRGQWTPQTYSGLRPSDFKEDFPLPLDKREDLEELLDRLDIDFWFELTPSEDKKAGDIFRDCLAILDRGISIIFANKAPIIHDYKSLKERALKKASYLGLSGVMGASLASYALTHYGCLGSQVLSMEGILNGTTNFILEEMEKGLSFHEALEQAKKDGIAEADPSRDIEGIDSAVKMSLIASVILDKNISYRPEDIRGIAGISLEEIERLKSEDKRLKLVASFDNERVRVSPQVFTKEELFYSVSGSEKALHIKTEGLSHMTLIGGKSGLREVASSLHRDLVWVQEISQGLF